jgi:hypothetical protein
MLVYPRVGWGNTVWAWHSLVWSAKCLSSRFGAGGGGGNSGSSASHLFSQCNVVWISFLWARGSGHRSLDSPWRFISTKCGSSISARFLSHRDHAFWFCTLVTILFNSSKSKSSEYKFVFLGSFHLRSLIFLLFGVFILKSCLVNFNLGSTPRAQWMLFFIYKLSFASFPSLGPLTAWHHTNLTWGIWRGRVLGSLRSSIISFRFRFPLPAFSITPPPRGNHSLPALTLTTSCSDFSFLIGFFPVWV